jgi:hypothetical protein
MSSINPKIKAKITKLIKFNNHNNNNNNSSKIILKLKDFSRKIYLFFKIFNLIK